MLTRNLLRNSLRTKASLNRMKKKSNFRRTHDQLKFRDYFRVFFEVINKELSPFEKHVAIAIISFPFVFYCTVRKKRQRCEKGAVFEPLLYSAMVTVPTVALWEIGLPCLFLGLLWKSTDPKKEE